MKKSKTKTYIRIPFLTPPNKRHKSVRDYDRRQNRQVVDVEIRDSTDKKEDNNANFNDRY